MTAGSPALPRKRSVALFISAFENKVDRKGRVSVPVSFRMALSEPQHCILVGYLPPNKALTGFDRSRLDSLYPQPSDGSLSDGSQPDPAEKEERIARERLRLQREMMGQSDDGVMDTLNANTRELPFDGEGRVVLPADLMKRANIEDRAIFVSRGSRFEIWNPDLYEKQREEEFKALAGEAA